MDALNQEITTLRARVEEAQKATERALTAVVPPFPVPSAANPQAPASVADVLAKQTELFAQLLHQKDTKRSTIRVTPQVRWPTLGDNGPWDKNVDEFFRKLDATCQLANDGKGMSENEKLTVLQQCFKG